VSYPLTVGSIRWRILKVKERIENAQINKSYSGLDPMEDTERQILHRLHVAPYPSYSGLDPMEDTERNAATFACRPCSASYSGLDPMEDTERQSVPRLTVGTDKLQWARSDGGY